MKALVNTLIAAVILANNLFGGLESVRTESIVLDSSINSYAENNTNLRERIPATPFPLESGSIP